MTRTPFPYWEYEARCAAQFEARYPGEELPRNDWVIRFGDRDAKLHHRPKSPPGSVDARRSTHKKRPTYPCQTGMASRRQQRPPCLLHPRAARRAAVTPPPVVARPRRGRSTGRS